MNRGRTAAARNAGFTLLESLVAMVVFAGAAIALYGLFNTNLIALGRAKDVSRQMSAARHALEYFAAVDPREERTGRIRVDGIDIVWSATLVEPARRSRTAAGDHGNFEIGLYKVVFELHEAGRMLDRWRVRIPGYRKIGEPVP